MRRRISQAIVGVSAVILIALGIPLAVVAQRSILNAEVVELQAEAARSLSEIDVPVRAGQILALRHRQSDLIGFGVYGLDGALKFGQGPLRADQTVQQALTGSTTSRTGAAVVVATPIIDHPTDRRVGVLWLAESRRESDGRFRNAVLIMFGSGAAALAVGWAIAHRVARVLFLPVTRLAAVVEQADSSGLLQRPAPSGVAEVDTLATALADGFDRVTDALARERRFSADVSHQLRTPVTGLRLRLELARSADDPRAAIDAALEDITRIEITVDHLLAFARDATPTEGSVQLDVAAEAAAARWQERASVAGRTVEVVMAEPVSVRASAGSVDQILDVVIDNALHHGQGTVRMSSRFLAGGGAIDVSDEGVGIGVADAERVFDRGHGHRHGIGLALARSLAEVEGGRLLLVHHQPTTFSLILLAIDETDGAEEGSQGR